MVEMFSTRFTNGPGISRAIFTSASSRFVGYNSISNAVIGLRDLPMPVKRPVLWTLAQFAW
jgi:hypothetical protein